jgi:acyl-CoA thioester hydrolase
MNVAAYVDAVSDAMFALQEAVGLGRHQIDTGRRSFVAAHVAADYRAEMLAGEVFSIETRVMRVGTKSARFAHRMLRVADGACVFDAENVSVYFDLDSRQALAIPQELRAALEGLQEGDGDAA